MTLKEKIYQRCQSLGFDYLFLNFDKNVLKKIEKYLHSLPKPIEVSISEEDQKANFLFILNSIDFSLWCYPENWKYLGKKGYSGLEKRFYAFFQEFGLKKVDFENFKKIISPKEDKSLSFLRYKIYLQTLNWLNQNYQGNFLNFLKKYGSSPEKFVFTLTQLPQYNDIAPKYNIYFYKKAQLLYWEMYLYNFLKDKEKISHLTIFPDYRVVSFLNYLGMINYKKELFDKINRGFEIKSGSRQEVELRAAAVLAGEWLAKELKKLEAELDFILWNLGRKKNLKFHKTRTIFY